jgi:hypothetical protein
MASRWEVANRKPSGGVRRRGSIRSAGGLTGQSNLNPRERFVRTVRHDAFDDAQIQLCGYCGNYSYQQEKAQPSRPNPHEVTFTKLSAL